jgi:hypothetical protein
VEDDMIGSGVSMTAGKNVARAFATVLVTLVALVVGFSANAMAAAPELAITQPLTGTFTNSQTPLLSGTSNDTTDPITLKIYAGASVAEPPVQTLTQLVPVEVSPGEATWGLTPEAALAAGQYTAVAEQTNTSSETGTSSAVTFTVDITPPAVSINALASPTEDPRPTLSGGAGVEAGDEATVGVVIFSGTVVGGTIEAEEGVAVSEGTWSYAAPLLPNGTYTAVAFQHDEAGNTGVSVAMTFTVATKPPAVSINTLPSATNNATPTITGTGGVAPGDTSTVTVSIHEKTLTGKVVASGNVPLVGGYWSYTPASKLPENTYTVQVTQSNESGELGSAAETFIVDVTAPAVTITAPANDSVLNVSRPTFSGRAGHASGDAQLVALKIYTGVSATGTPVQELKLTPNGAYEWSTGSTGPVLADGIYTARVEQSDDAGNLGKSTVTFAIKTNSPKVTLNQSTFVARAGKLVTGPTPSFNGTGGSEPEDSTTVVVKVYSGTSTSGSPVRTAEGTLSGSQWTSTEVEAMPDGTYTAQAEQAGASPGQAGVSESVTFTVDADPPRVTLTSPTNGAVSSSETEAVSGAAGTQEGDLPGITVDLYAGSAVTPSRLEAIAVQASGGSWSATFGGLSPGTYTARADQGDDVGNIGYSEAVTFTVATTGAGQSTPVAPSASFRWIPAAPLTGEPVTLVSTSADSSSPIASYAWAPSGNGVFAPGEGTLTTSFATPGAHVVQLRVTDAAGQSSTIAETIPVSTAPVPLMQPFPVVRMAGSYYATGARITVLSVLAPVGARVAITCRGPHCPTKSLAFIATAGAKNKSGTVLINFRRFERSLRGGVVLEIWVSKPGEIGKFTRFTIRRGKSPSRVDECLNPAGTVPLVCPS